MTLTESNTAEQMILDAVARRDNELAGTAETFCPPPNPPTPMKSSAAWHSHADRAGRRSTRQKDSHEQRQPNPQMS